MIPGMAVAGPHRSHLLTIVSVALLAYALDDLVHEVLGHAAACAWLGVRMLGLSTIGLQTASSSRAVAAAGAIANVVVGAAVLLGLRRPRRFRTGTWFMWLFGFVNLMNGTGYLMASALTGSGDWAVVIAGREPAIAWRAGMGLIGGVAFAGSVRWAGAILRGWVAAGEVAPADVPRLTGVPYLAGGFLFVLASVFNPVGPSMILLSGAAASFGLTFGLLIVMRAEVPAPAHAVPAPLPLQWGWVAAGLLVAAGFVAILGPGVRF